MSHTATPPVAECEVVDPSGNGAIARARQPATFHVSHGMVCFAGGILLTLGVMWLVSEMSGKRRKAE